MIIGFVNGFFGGGGGMLAVPCLGIILDMNERVSHASALTVILPMSIASGLSYAFSKTFELKTLAFVTLGATIGGLLGAWLLKKIQAKWIPKLFALVVLSAGTKMLFF